jgi:hypothetical protein
VPARDTSPLFVAHQRTDGDAPLDQLGQNSAGIAARCPTIKTFICSASVDRRQVLAAVVMTTRPA